MIDYLEFKEDIKIIYQDIITCYNLNIDLDERNFVVLSNEKCVIEFIYQRYDGIEVRVKEPHTGFLITPFTWAVLSEPNKISFMKMTSGFDSERDKIKCLLYMNRMVLILYCLELLGGNFSKKDLYQKGQAEQESLYKELKKLDHNDSIYIKAFKSESRICESTWQQDLRERLKNS